MFCSIRSILSIFTENNSIKVISYKWYPIVGRKKSQSIFQKKIIIYLFLTFSMLFIITFFNLFLFLYCISTEVIEKAILINILKKVIIIINFYIFPLNINQIGKAFICLFLFCICFDKKMHVCKTFYPIS